MTAVEEAERQIAQVLRRLEVGDQADEWAGAIAALLGANGALRDDAELARLQATIAHLRAGGSVPPPYTTPAAVPVHTLRYHDCLGEEPVYRHFWLECSIDGGPWHRVSGIGTTDEVCPCPGAGKVSGNRR